MSDDFRNLEDERRARAVEVLITSATDVEAAQELHVTTRTIRRWRADPSFRLALVQAAREERERIRAQVADLRTEAIEALRRNLAPGTSPASELKAATIVLGPVLAQDSRMEETEQEREETLRLFDAFERAVIEVCTVEQRAQIAQRIPDIMFKVGDMDHEAAVPG